MRQEEIYIKYSYLFEDDNQTLKQINKNAKYNDTNKKLIDNINFQRKSPINQNSPEQKLMFKTEYGIRFNKEKSVDLEK